MRHAVVSDIHGNLEALSAVLARIAPDDRVLSLGDIVGYGPDPNACVALVRECASIAVLGNHDVGAIDNHALDSFNPAAREAIAWTQGVLSSEHEAWLDGLAYEHREPAFLMVHGAPQNYFEYILDKEAAARAFAATDAPLVFVGHTHIAEYYALRPDGAIAHEHRQHGGTLTLEAGTRYIVNVGSVGQPRDLNPEASFAFYEPDESRITWMRVPYPIARTQDKIAQAELPALLADRLSAGR
ncbi:MAG: metallophosphoesterase family protein [Vulcanimicrobiaceae bacterium]